MALSSRMWIVAGVGWFQLQAGSLAWAQSGCAEPVARVVSVQGEVLLDRSLAVLDDAVCPGVIVHVGTRSRAAVLLLDHNTILRIDQNTRYVVAPAEDGEGFVVEVLRGVVHFFSRVPRSLRIKTPFINAGIEGTELVIRVGDDQSDVLVLEGLVRVDNSHGELLLTSGEAATAERGRAPVRREVVRPRDAVQWALYYPQVGVGEASSPAAPAAELLAVGRVDEAVTLLDEVRAVDRSDPVAPALLALIAVTQNRTKDALALADEAVSRDPDSATARSALSYALQSVFDIDGALTAAAEAVELRPDDVLAWARLSELQSAVGDRRAALDSANRAVGIDGGLGRAQTVLGFVHLNRIEIDAAMSAFERAIALDPSDPEPRLGLGLALIRRNHLVEGREQIEIAVGLDPNNGLLRSYLGKAYFEERRDEKAASEFGIAKALDPQDPTPYYYDAIRKQSVNRPVEALADLQRSIELNQGRAVYRSDFLLDDDLAARSASIARIYDDLGFRQRALVEGWNAVDTEFGNFSAHRLLADSYSVLPRHQIARVSELLQSQLRQPLQANPVQTQLVEPGLAILEGTAPFEPSFNEYNTLFTRNGPALQISGMGGSNDTVGGEAILSGIHDKVSGSVNLFSYETDGFRTNDDQDQQIAGAFLQQAVTPEFSWQAEARYSDIDRGDLFLRFNPENFLPGLREVTETRSLRLGGRYEFSPRSDVIGNIRYSDLDFDLDIDGDDIVDIDQDGYQAEVQHLIRFDDVSLISGLGYFEQDTTDTSVLGPGEVLVRNLDADHANAYVYSLIDYPESVTWTLGGSFDSVDGLLVDEDQFNPKLGVIWRPRYGTSVRAAAFRTLQRALLAEQTLEPTSVAGFNQFFDDGEGAEVDRYGIGLDQVFTAGLFGGIELSQRELKVPGEIFVPPEPVVETGELEEDLNRAYLYWTPTDRLALSVEYQNEQFERDIRFIGPEEISTLDTDRLLFGLNWFHPSGLRFGVTPAYVDQSGRFAAPDFSGDTVAGDDSFWVVDLELAYRLPKRRGLITFGVKNAFDEEFLFQDTDPEHPQILPERFIFGKISLSF